MIKGKQIFKSEKYADLYDTIEKEIEDKLAKIQYTSDEDFTEEEQDKLERIMDYKFRAQEALENSGIFFEKLLEL